MNPVISNFLGKTWGVVKPHIFPMLLVFVVTVAGYRFLLKIREADQAAYGDRLSQYEKLRDEQIKKIEDAYAIERKAHEENLKALQVSLDAFQQKHDADIKALDEKKANAVKKLVKDLGDNPAAMAAKVSEVTGFKVVAPENFK